MSGYFDVTLENPAIKLNAATDVMLTYGGSTIAEDSYVGKEDPRNPLISPLFGDLSVLPPTLIQIGTADMLLWDCRKFYLKCLDLNVGVEYEEYPDAFHDFMMAGFLPEAKRALKSQTEFLLR